ncbi:MAG: glycogen debranching N-terminal domain-containing protein, partial [Gaiellaceae bacterium]
MTAQTQPASTDESQANPLGALGNLDDTLVIKRGNLFAVSMRDGRIPPEGKHPLGLYYRDCRFLSAHELRVAGALPLLLVASDALGTEAVHEMTNPDLELPDGSVLAAQSLQIRLDRRFDPPHAMRELVTVRSHHRAPVRVALGLRLAADFEPMLAIRGIVGGSRRLSPPVRLDGECILIEAKGRDDVLRSTTIAASPAPESAQGGVLTFELDLPPGEARTVELRYALSEAGEGAPAEPPLVASGNGVAGQADGREWLASHPRVSSDDQLFDRVLERSLLDLWL